MTHSKAPRPHAPRTVGPSAGYPRSGGFKPVALPAFTSAIALGVLRNRIQGQPIDAPLNDPNLRGLAINHVSPLDPSGWMRVVLTPTR